MADNHHFQKPLTQRTFQKGLSILTRNDPDLAKIVVDFGPPPFWNRKPGFTTLVHIILEQQVSLASARAVLNKLMHAVSPLTPKKFLEQDDKTLKTFGFSRQKTAYCRNFAELITTGQLDLKQLNSKNDEQVRRTLTEVKGIGRWTANIYLLMALRRPDIWPVGDLALESAIQKLKNLPARPRSDESKNIAADWKPWRAVAARILWHYYLSNGRDREPSQKPVCSL
ncbi:MAG: DNA-3-methyladenine glycosylase 2 family protein [Deltaproteobacteria bacterium]|nr:MAG: DNA-3-methyladenine glycosylase 2 family protein [Deltaproteobacteria bacterium]